MRWRRHADAIARRDAEVMETVHRRQFPSVVDRGLPLLTRAADRSVLWVGVAAALGATGNRRARRAAARGLGSIAVSSLVANQIGKRIVPRRRPLLDRIPVARIAARVPTSSSFPSGHSASAAAFAVGASLELPELAVPLGALAGAVAFSRIYTGVHYPSDVVAGAALGATVAAIGRIVVPAHSRVPRRTGGEPRAPQPPRPTGRGVVVVVNVASGSGQGRRLATTLRAELPNAEVIEVAPGAGAGEDSGDDIAEVLRRAADHAEVLGVAGGDGTVSAAAAVAIDRQLPLLVVPGGTVNHCAKDLCLDWVDDSIAALRAGRAVRMDVASANGQVFVNMASLGSYPMFVEIRERWERRVGKPIAAAVAIAHVLRRCPPVPAQWDGRTRHLAILFVGNGEYQPANIAPHWRERLDTGRLDVRFIDAQQTGALPRLVVSALLGRLHRSAHLEQQRRPDLTIRLPAAPGLFAHDGEVGGAAREVTFRIHRGALTVYRAVPGQ